MTTKEKIKIMKAYLDGKPIQIKMAFSSEDWHDYCEHNEPVWAWAKCDYRIKPEPKLRPYKSAEDFLQAQKEHGMMIKSCGQYFFATMVDRDRGIVINNIKGSIFITYQELLESRLWQNGTPCGIEE